MMGRGKVMKTPFILIQSHKLKGIKINRLRKHVRKFQEHKLATPRKLNNLKSNPWNWSISKTKTRTKSQIQSQPKKTSSASPT
jgi:hypothetical protein